MDMTVPEASDDCESGTINDFVSSWDLDLSLLTHSNNPTVLDENDTI